MTKRLAFLQFLAAYLDRHAKRSSSINAAAIVELCEKYEDGRQRVSRIIAAQNVTDFNLDASLSRFSDGERRFWRVLATKGRAKRVCFLRHQGEKTYGHYIHTPPGFKVRRITAVKRAERAIELLAAKGRADRNWVIID